MKSLYRLKKTIIILLLIILVSACTSKSEPFIANKSITTQSNERVNIVASNANAYSWKQISGIEVVLINANTDTLSFIAPVVQTKESLVFEVKALMPSALKKDIIIIQRATVIVHPLEIVTDSNETSATISSNEINTTNSLKSIKLTIDKTSLNLDENTTLNVLATYSDNTTKDVTNEVEWLRSSDDSLKIDSHSLTALKEVNTILQARLNNIVSNSVAIEMFIKINGHKLPPMPNEVINNATLLGVDSNDNGVRDDVERWIFSQYKEPIVQAVAMQNARAFQIILADPSKAKETKKFTEAQLDCKSYYMFQDERKLIPRGTNLHKESRPLMLNTRERSRAYYEFNQALSGGVYPGRDRSKYKESCDFNETKVERGEW